MNCMYFLFPEGFQGEMKVVDVLLETFVGDLVECEKRKRKKEVNDLLALTMVAIFMVM